MDPKTRRRWVPIFVSGIIALVVWSCVVWLRTAGRLQDTELYFYDRLIESTDHRRPDRATVIGITEESITSKDPERRVHFPISDLEMARVLEKLLSYHPRAIGIDIFRDMQISYRGEGDGTANRERLVKLWKDHPEIVIVYELEVTDPPDEIDPQQQGGFADMEPDNDQVIRRDLFSVAATDDKGNAVDLYSMAYQLARIYLEQEMNPPVVGPVGVGEQKNYQFGPTLFRPFNGTEGPFAKGDSHGTQFLIDSTTHDRHVPIPIDEVLTGKVDPAAIRDKVVLLGMTTPTVKDNLDTPLGRWFGVQVHAAAVEQLIRAAEGVSGPLRYWPRPVNLVWALLWSLAGAALGFVVRVSWRYPAIAVAAIAGLGALGVALLYLMALQGFRSNLWIPLVPPALAWLASAALVTVYLSGSERKARGAIMQMFSRSVSKDVAQSMWDQQEDFLDGGRPRPQPLVATVLFSDLKGFSSLSEKRTPEEVMHWLNELMGELTRCVDSNRGVVNKYIGDAVMALFGVPVPRSTPQEEAQDAKNAVRCALGMREALRRFNEKWKGQLPQIRMRIGVYTGPVVAGGLGNADRLEYTVIGNTVNIASRLESHKKELMDEDITAHGCRILIGKSTHDRLGGEFETREIENASLHNIAEEVAVFGVIGASRPEALAEGMKVCVAKT